MNIGRRAAMRAIDFQCMNVPRTWHSQIPNEIDSVMDARRKPRLLGELEKKVELKLSSGKSKVQAPGFSDVNTRRRS